MVSMTTATRKLPIRRRTNAQYAAMISSTSLPRNVTMAMCRMGMVVRRCASSSVTGLCPQ